MLEGNEIEKVYDNGAGKLIVDVDATGKVLISNVYTKDMGAATVHSVTEVKTDILDLLQNVAAKTKTTLDDKAIALIKSLLGLSQVQE